MTPSVDIVLISWNGRDDTLAALAAVDGEIARTPSVRCGVIVVDNGSADGTSEAVMHQFPQVRLSRHDDNSGFTGGIARGVALSTADHVIFLNNDAVPEEGWLAELTGAIAGSAPDIIAVGGKIVDMSGLLVDFVGGAMTFDGHAFQMHFRRPLEAVTDPADGEELLFACGGNMIVRRRPFLSVGGFDDDYFAYLEDVDFGWRAWIAGWKIVYARDAVVRHKSAATSERLGVFRRGVLFERNAFQTAFKNYADEQMRDVCGQIYLSLLHRLHHDVVERNPGIRALIKSGAAERPSEPSLPSRILRRIAPQFADRDPEPRLDDPLAVMQLRAIEWIFQNQQRLADKREAVQAMRKRTDEEILSRFPVHYVPTYPGDAELMASPLFRMMAPRLPSTNKKLVDIMQA